MNVSIRSEEPKVQFNPFSIIIGLDDYESAMKLYKAWEADREIDFTLFRELQKELQKQGLVPYPDFNK